MQDKAAALVLIALAALGFAFSLGPSVDPHISALCEGEQGVVEPGQGMTVEKLGQEVHEVDCSQPEKYTADAVSHPGEPYYLPETGTVLVALILLFLFPAILYHVYLTENLEFLIERFEHIVISVFLVLAAFTASFLFSYLSWYFSMISFLLLLAAIPLGLYLWTEERKAFGIDLLLVFSLFVSLSALYFFFRPTSFYMAYAMLVG